MSKTPPPGTGCYAIQNVRLNRGYELVRNKNFSPSLKETAVDACTWLLDNDVAPDRIRWVRPRDAWFLDRAAFQPLDQVGGIIEGLSLDGLITAEQEDVLRDLLLGTCSHAV